MVKAVIYHNKYRDLSLDSVSRALLNEGKLENLVVSKSKSFQKKNN
jgi:hypothetical protein